jgi:serine/threonine protein kinase
MSGIAKPDSLLSERYRLMRRLGRGGVADVYEATDEKLARSVAVKVLRAGDLGATERFNSEMRILAQLSHPGIVSIYDAGQTEDEEPFLVMELIRGPSLDEALSNGAFEEPRVRGIAASVAGALAYAHGLGVVHRDVKPSNVLLGEHGTAQLSDFGIARLVDAARVTSTGETVGTAAYLAPEQLEREEQAGPSADVYALGLVLLECLTGRKAFPGTGVEAAMARLSRDPEVPEWLPGTWVSLLTGMTRRDAEARPTAEQARDELPELGAGVDVPGTETVAFGPGEGPTERLGGGTRAFDRPRPDERPRRPPPRREDLPPPRRRPAPPPTPPRRSPQTRSRAIWLLAIAAGVLLVGVLAFTALQGLFSGGEAPAEPAPAEAEQGGQEGQPEGGGQGGDGQDEPMDVPMSELEPGTRRAFERLEDAVTR